MVLRQHCFVRTRRKYEMNGDFGLLPAANPATARLRTFHKRIQRGKRRVCRVLNDKGFRLT